MSESNESHAGTPGRVGRRHFLKGSGVIAGAVPLTGTLTAADQPDAKPANATAEAPTVEISFRLNGRPITRRIDTRTTLVDLLREDLQMFGTKKGCDHGACGACTVHIDGNRVLSCLTLAATIDGSDVRTIEGVADGEHLHPLQEAFLRCDAYQCGYCTPGQIMSGLACIDEGHAAGSAEEAREWMSGNLCRCSAYPNILSAVRQTAGAEDVGDPSVQSNQGPVQ